MRLLHALAALLTVMLLFIRQRCVCAGPGPAKRGSLQACACSCGDTLTTVPLPSGDCVVCARAACLYGEPKYKRDPDIMVDNETIGPPHDY